MTCADSEARLIDLVERRLDAATEVRLHGHLEGCPACRARAELWQGLTPALRSLEPEPPHAMKVRRLQVEVARQLAAGPAKAAGDRGGIWLKAGLALAGAAAAAALIAVPALRGGKAPPPPGAAAFASVIRVEGAVTSGGRPLALAATLVPGNDVTIAGEGEAELTLARGSRLAVSGPGGLTLAGSAGDLLVRLDRGTVDAEVVRRLDGERFAIATRDLRAEVRGTRFSVGADGVASWVRVDEGRVAVTLSTGATRTLSAGETIRSDAADAPPEERPEPSGPSRPYRQSCGELARLCRATATGAREKMRAGEHDRALRLVSEAGRRFGDAPPVCGEPVTSCADDLRYLRAEALRGAGRVESAIEAFKALDRREAPPAMRQNALYAAAQLEQRRGNHDQARADFERALASAPRGALREEALIGAMESAAAAGDTARARTLARRYLADHPKGWRVSAAKAWAGTAP